MDPIGLSDTAESSKLMQPALAKAFNQVLTQGDFINGAAVSTFAQALGKYLRVASVIPCGNGTDALQIALMALNLPFGSEVIVPAFNYVAAMEAVALLGLVPVLADVLPDTFNLDPTSVIAKISAKTRAIIVVHLFGQCADLAALLQISRLHQLYLIEDNAQSLGAQYKSQNGSTFYAGTVGHIGTTSFFPTKMLGALGDGGAIFTNDLKMATSMQQIARHGQQQKYQYEQIGVNSRLDTLQAAFLSVKLKFLNNNIAQRQLRAQEYGNLLHRLPLVKIPGRADYSTHVFNQYVVQVPEVHRDKLRQYLQQHQIPTAVYYPTPLHVQPAYRYLNYHSGNFPVAETVCQKVVALPMHTALTLDQVQYIAQHIITYFETHS
ncbi:DegT/DnrJ/EryC1/StrS family aminotransferase [Adhaeribacter pallidiroseus]|uniref:UDP-2-acetamido-2-deoxy-ribo-hexuluronate aminotransferase n=1 Tax=Adhaeribacter pallidiroseus TaxID=2072847 RepID=A0A369QEK1_9BACT|nr:DegT/DnrJ/EryC1/StrS family aminotransferase [Adhaeribacter pallidiroseus]RDC62005.1 UDP-2-acetamido-2-deoxy-ribo-hexuluronate aminotransferase [Adhaeribacter pallidiroseus]